jgi:hypothetical protein
MTESQKKAIQLIFNDLHTNNKSLDGLLPKDFNKATKGSGVNLPWKILDQYKDGKVFNFTKLFEKALGINLTVQEMPESFPVPEEPEISEKAEESVEQPAPASEPTPAKRPRKKSTNSTRKIASIPDSKLMIFKDPVYFVESIDSTGLTNPVGVARSFKGVCDKLIYRAIHDHGKVDREEAEVAVETKGVVKFHSLHSRNLWCVITKIELE